MIPRAIVLSVLIAVAGVGSAHLAGAERPVSRQPLATLPRAFDGWRLVRDEPLDPEILGVLGADDYINRTYVGPDRAAVNLYIGYYTSQRQGDAIHSPQNCLPGAGWQPTSSSRIDLEAGGREMPVNRYVIQKGLDRQVVYYWYQGRGRIVANEYANKFWLMVDAARLQRTNGALVRVITPVNASTEAADAVATAFSRALTARLGPFLP
jgi:EpsI family protein